MSGKNLYEPCRTGLHVCGVLPDGFFTHYNYRVATIELARKMFGLYRAEFGVPAMQEDFIVDLFEDGSMTDNFSISSENLFKMVRV